MQKITEAGQLTKIVTHTRRKLKKSDKPRSQKEKVTQAAQQRANDRRSRERLEEMLYANFTSADYFCTLTYDDAHLLTRWKYIQADVQNLIHRIRYHRGRRGDSLRYIYVIEGMHGDKRTHIHIVLNTPESGIEVYEELRAAWRGGSVDAKPLSDYETLGAVAQYLTKESMTEEGRAMKGVNAWHASRNCVKPIVKVSGSEKAPFAPPGAVILERESRMDFTGERFNYLKFLRPANQQGEQQ